MLVGFLNLMSHSQNIASGELSLFSAELSSLNSIEGKLFSGNSLPTYKDVTNAGKFGKASANAIGYNITMGTILFLAPESFTNWRKEDKLRIESILSQFGESYSNLPVIDNDDWHVNYIGHPYQGSFYYNSLRSQDVSFWYSSLFCLGNTLLWEYVWEAGFEQPSIQDLIVTPIVKVLSGELIHRATITMSKNGFRWYEIVLVTGLNPAYAINNKFVFNHKKQKKTATIEGGSTNWYF
jgi:hypothetical protein